MALERAGTQCLLVKEYMCKSMNQYNLLISGQDNLNWRVETQQGKESDSFPYSSFLIGFY